MPTLNELMQHQPQEHLPFAEKCVAAMAQLQGEGPQKPLPELLPPSAHKFLGKLYHLGLWILPLIPSGKQTIKGVMWSEYRDGILPRPSKEQVKKWFKNRKYNIGIMLGNSNLVIVDADSRALVQWADKNLPFTPMQTSTKRGKHYYYRGTDVPSKDIEITIQGITHTLEVIGSKRMITAPMSIRDGGKFIYVPLGKWDIEALNAVPTFNWKWVGGVPTTVKTVHTDKPSEPVKALESLRPDVRKQVQAFLDDGAEVGTRNPTVFKIACLLKGSHFDKATALDLLVDRAEEDQLPRHEAENAVESAFSTDRALIEPPFGAGQTDWIEPLDAHHVVTGKQSKGRCVEVTYIEDIVVDYVDTDAYIWGDVIRRNWLTLMQGAPKTGKTSLIATIIKHMQHGVEEFGNREIKPGKVLYLNEEPVDIWQSRKEMLEIHKGRTVAILGLHERDKDGNLKWDKTRIDWSLDGVANTIKEEKFDMVVIDTLSVWMAIKNENDNALFIEALSKIREYLGEIGCAVVIIHHERKQGKEQYCIEQRGRGASSIPGCVDMLVSVQRMDASLENKERRVEFLGRRKFPMPMIMEWDDNDTYVVVDTGVAPEIAGTIDEIKQILWKSEKALTLIQVQNISTLKTRSSVQRKLHRGRKEGIFHCLKSTTGGADLWSLSDTIPLSADTGIDLEW